MDKEKVRWGTPKPRSKTKYACGEETSIFPGSGLVKQVTPLKQESPSFLGGECQIIRDEQDSGVADDPNTPAYDGNPLDLPANFDPGTPDNPSDDLNYEFPIVIQDKTFDADGNLYYPAIPGDPLAGPGDPTVPIAPGVDGFGNVNPFPGSPDSPTVVAEYAGDVMIVNGQAWPTLDVEPRTYRFRLLNGSDSRFYELRLTKGNDFQVIGSDNGLLDGPAVPVRRLPIGPGERYDVIIDFSNDPGKTITLRNVNGGLGTEPVFNDYRQCFLESLGTSGRG